MALLKPGDTLVTEHLTYPGLISVARMLGIKLIGVGMDDEGLLPDALSDVCQQHRVSALYCTPTIQNPTAAVMSVPRREAIAEVCRQHNLLMHRRRSPCRAGAAASLAFEPLCPGALGVDRQPEQSGVGGFARGLSACAATVDRTLECSGARDLLDGQSALHGAGDCVVRKRYRRTVAGGSRSPKSAAASGWSATVLEEWAPDAPHSPHFADRSTRAVARFADCG